MAFGGGFSLLQAAGDEYAGLSVQKKEVRLFAFAPRGAFRLWNYFEQQITPGYTPSHAVDSLVSQRDTPFWSYALAAGHPLDSELAVTAGPAKELIENAARRNRAKHSSSLGRCIEQRHPHSKACQRFGSSRRTTVTPVPASIRKGLCLRTYSTTAVRVSMLVILSRDFGRSTISRSMGNRPPPDAST